MKQWTLTFLLAGAVLVFPAHAFDVNDCIINGMKGVSSDVAARLVRVACDQKLKIFKEQESTKLAAIYGDTINPELIVPASSFEFVTMRIHSLKFTNKTDMTLLYVRIEVAPASAPGAPCDPEKVRIFAYKTTVKPGAAVNLVYPAATSSECVVATVARGRTSSWKDVSFSTSIKPEEKDPLSGLD